MSLALDTQGQINMKVTWEDILPNRPPRPIADVLGAVEDWGPVPEPLANQPKAVEDYLENIPLVSTFISTGKDFTKIQLEIKLQAACNGM